MPTPKRKHLVQSAGYWFDAARKAQLDGEMAVALIAMENAYNHVENALAGERERGTKALRRISMRLTDGATPHDFARAVLDGEISP